jgi:hypothetical protein
MYRGILKPPKSNRKKIIIIVISIFVCLSAFGGLYYVVRGSGDKGNVDEFGRRRREWNDNNLPNPNKQTGQQILAYMDSAEFKRLSAREQFRYMGAGQEKVMQYEMDTYFSLPNEQQKTAYLDKIINRMQAQRTEFEQMRQQRPPRRRDANEPNDPNRPRFGPGGGRTFSASNMRARSEQGTPTQRAQRDAFMQAMRQRMQQRGITMPGPGGGRGGGRGGR